MDTSERQLTIRSAGLTDIGCVRERNEDAFLADAEHGVFIVADGIGGRQGGDVASRRVVELLSQIVKRRIGEMPKPEEGDDASILALLMESMSEASRAIRAEGEKKLECLGMGTTAAVALVTSRHAHVAYMGDSRAYLLRGGEIRLLTEDHSIVGALLRHGEISPQEAVDHPARGRLTRFVGMEMDVEPGGLTLALEAGDRLLLCTDGLWGMVGDAKLCEILSARGDCEITCEDLIATGKAAGGEDNLTAVVTDIYESEQRDGDLIFHEFPPPRRLWKAMQAKYAKSLIEHGEFFAGNVNIYRHANPGPMRDTKEGVGEYFLGGIPQTSRRGNDIHIWCATTEKDWPAILNQRPDCDTIVEISDCLELFRRVKLACAKAGINWSELRAGHAQYDRGGSFRQPPSWGHDYVQKGVGYRLQKEYRFIIVMNYEEEYQPALKLQLGDCRDIVRIVAQRKEPAR